MPICNIYKKECSLFFLFLLLLMSLIQRQPLYTFFVRVLLKINNYRFLFAVQK